MGVSLEARASSRLPSRYLSRATTGLPKNPVMDSKATSGSDYSIAGISLRVQSTGGI